MLPDPDPVLPPTGLLPEPPLDGSIVLPSISDPEGSLSEPEGSIVLPVEDEPIVIIVNVPQTGSIVLPVDTRHHVVTTLPLDNGVILLPSEKDELTEGDETGGVVLLPTTDSLHDESVSVILLPTVGDDDLKIDEPTGVMLLPLEGEDAAVILVPSVAPPTAAVVLPSQDASSVGVAILPVDINYKPPIRPPVYPYPPRTDDGETPPPTDGNPTANQANSPMLKRMWIAFMTGCRRPNWLLLAIAMTAVSVVYISLGEESVVAASSKKTEGFITRPTSSSPTSSSPSITDTIDVAIRVMLVGDNSNDDRLIAQLLASLRKRYMRSVDVKVMIACGAMMACSYL